MKLFLRLFTFTYLLILAITVHAQGVWEMQLNNPYQNSFQKAYDLYPNIPKGILEAVAYSNTHFQHINPTDEAASCLGLPAYHGVMGLVQDPSLLYSQTNEQLRLNYL